MLIACPECKSQISNLAISCPSCGVAIACPECGHMHASVEQAPVSTPLASYQTKFRVMTLVTGLLALGLSWFGYLVFNPPATTKLPIEPVTTVEKSKATPKPKTRGNAQATEPIKKTGKNGIANPTKIEQTTGTYEDNLDLANQNTLATIQFSRFGEFGSHLIPNLAKEFLRTQGISELKQVPTNSIGETAIVGNSGDGLSGRSVKIIIRSVAGPPQNIGANEVYIGTLPDETKLDPEELSSSENSDSKSHKAHEIAFESLVLIVHPSNPVVMLSKDQVAAILSGMITDWSQVRGKPGKIKIYMIRGKRGWNDTIKSSILGNLSLAANVVGFDDPADVEKQVVSDKESIGLIKFSEVKNAKLLGISVVGKTPVIPNRRTIATQTYPLTKPIYLYFPLESNSKLLNRLLWFTRSNSARKVVTQAGYIYPERLLKSVSKLQMTVREYQELTENAMRLSFEIRFDSNSTRLNGAGQRSISKVSDFLNDLGMEDKRLMVFGFTDSLGLPDINLSLSEKRAQAVAASLKEKGIKTEIAVGLGDQNPTASNKTITGRSLNRRVEIWIKKQVDDRR